MDRTYFVSAYPPGIMESGLIGIGIIHFDSCIDIGKSRFPVDTKARKNQKKDGIDRPIIISNIELIVILYWPLFSNMIVNTAPTRHKNP